MNHLPYIQQQHILMDWSMPPCRSAARRAGTCQRIGGFYTDPEAARILVLNIWKRTTSFWPYMEPSMPSSSGRTHAEGVDPEACDAKWLELQRRFMPVWIGAGWKPRS